MRLKRFHDIEDEEEFEEIANAEWWGGFAAGSMLFSFLFTILWVLFSSPTFLRWLFR